MNDEEIDRLTERLLDGDRPPAIQHARQVVANVDTNDGNPFNALVFAMLTYHWTFDEIQDELDDASELVKGVREKAVDEFGGV
jgi:hypothetical protein